MTATPAAPGLPVRHTVLEIITSLRPQHGGITDTTTLAELGCDSLDRLALAVAIEQTTGVAIADTVLPELRSVADVIKTVEKGQTP